MQLLQAFPAVLEHCRLENHDLTPNITLTHLTLTLLLTLPLTLDLTLDLTLALTLVPTPALVGDDDVRHQHHLHYSICRL